MEERFGVSPLEVFGAVVAIILLGVFVFGLGWVVIADLHDCGSQMVYVAGECVSVAP